MAVVTLIKPDEKLVYRYGDTVFYYKRMLPIVAENLQRKHSIRGEADNIGMGFAIVRQHLLDWDNVQDGNGEKVPFNLDILDQFSADILTRLILVIGSNDAEYAEVSTMGEAIDSLKSKRTEKNL